METKFTRIAALAAVELCLLSFLIAQSKPIWTDEVLQFVTGAIPSPVQATRVIYASIQNGLNHGQTGIHMMVNYFLLRAFGASYLVFRGPSYLAYLGALTFGFLFLVEAGVSTLVGFLFVFGLGLSQLNLVHGWEARPYILLEASVVGFLWVWQRYSSGRSLSVVCAAAAVGILFHPFFIAYAGMLVVGNLLFDAAARRRVLQRLGSRSALVSASACAAALVLLFVAVGASSWLHTAGIHFQYDPYQFIGREKSLPRFMLGTFFFPASILAIPLLALLSAGLLWFRRDKTLAPLVPPFFSLTLALFVTQLVITLSVLRSGYWILQRQWIAGNALAFLIGALLLEFLLRKVRVPERVQRGLLLGLLLFGVSGLSVASFRNLRVPRSAPLTREEKDALLTRVAATRNPVMSDLENLARENLFEGGPVWPVFRRYYEPDTPQ